MCGIVGFVGMEQAAPILLEGLSNLEYRGYDSAGVAIVTHASNENEAAKIEVVKAKGRLQKLCEMTDNGHALEGFCGIGHTRWATHGEPSVANAHPHYNKDRSIVLVHNGIIENYQALKEKLIRKGYEFTSQTDTEVVVHLLDSYYNGNPLEAIVHVMLRLRGSYSLGILFLDHPNEIYAVRKASPLIVGLSDKGSYIASDVPAILKRTRNVVFMEDQEVVKLTETGATFYNIDKEEIPKEPTLIHWDAEAAEKGGFEHFLLKEIYEQPRAVRDTISPYLVDGELKMEDLNLTDEEIRQMSRIYIVGCGSAYHVAMSAKYVLENMTRIPVEVDLASEFRYRDPILDANAMVIVISQSGETADSIAALREAKSRGVRVLGIVNVVGSSIAREVDTIFYTCAGPEISVATTKAYSTQLAAIYLIGMYFAQVRGTIEPEEMTVMINELQQLPKKIEQILEDKERIQWFANKFSASRDVFFLGRGMDYATSLEGSLKLKEISYIHSEAYAAGELKHGTISLIEQGTLVVAVATQDALFDKVISNVVEVKSRGAYIMGLTNYGHYAMEDVADFTVYVPKTHKYFTTSLAVVPLQLMAYYISVAKGLDVDKPRNLAKSVTVE